MREKSLNCDNSHVTKFHVTKTRMSVDVAENRMWENYHVKTHVRKFLSLMMITHMRETLLCDENFPIRKLSCED